MSNDRDDRTTQLRQLLVEGATRAEKERQRPWRLVSLVAGIALASGVTGALSATALTQSMPYDEKTTTTLALSVARPNSTAVGQPFYVSSRTAATIQLGEQPAAATGLAIRAQCTDPGSVDIALDGTRIWSFSCTEESTGGGGGSVSAVSGSGDHELSFTGSGGAFAAWIVWVTEPPMPESSAQQTAEIADGVVTRDEYVAAFNRFVGCMGGAGYEIGGVDIDGIFTYSIPSAAVTSGADELCYVTQFGAVDMAWQVQNASG